ncbi:MAG: CHAT domain-containing protein, partial [Thermoleophilia bacterium]
GLAAQVERWEHEGIHRGSPDPTPLLREIGSLLLAPAAGRGWLHPSSGKKRITFVPTHVLHGLPFAAVGVPDCTNYVPLVCRVEIVVCPQFAVRSYQLEKRPQGEGMVAVLNPDSSLRFDDGEAACLRERFVDAVIYQRDLPEPITPDALKRIVRGARHLHLSCHGVFDTTSPFESRLLLAAIEGHPTAITAMELYDIPDRFELIVAAACESGTMEVLEGEATLGITRALMYLSRWVVSALWCIDDEATSLLLERFYSAFSIHDDPVRALAEAQRAIALGQSGAALDTTHPYYWAGMSILG